MTVAELIEKLKELDQQKLVVVKGYEGGWDDAAIGSNWVFLNKNIKEDGTKIHWYYGKHDDALPNETGAAKVMTLYGTI